MCGRQRGGIGGGAISYDSEKPWSSIIQSVLSGDKDLANAALGINIVAPATAKHGILMGGGGGRGGGGVAAEYKDDSS
jgi:hypothetical protein